MKGGNRKRGRGRREDKEGKEGMERRREDDDKEQKSNRKGAEIREGGTKEGRDKGKR